MIDRWAKEPKAWHRIPEMSPYGTAKAMIEAEVCENYEAFVEFIKEIVGASYAAKLADNHGDRPGPKEGTVNNPNGNGGWSGKKTDNTHLDNGYVHNHYQDESARRGTNSTYLLERIAKESPETTELIGKGKQFKSFHEFLEAYPPEGLHTSLDVLMKICKSYEDMEAVDMLAQESAGSKGGNNPDGIGGKSGKKKHIDEDNNVNIINRVSPTGNSTAATMRRLAKDFPEAHARVLSGAVATEEEYA